MAPRSFRSLLILGLCFVTAVSSIATSSHHTLPRGLPYDVSITGDLHTQPSPAVTVSNVFQTITSWSPDSFRGPLPPADDLTARFPFIRYVELFTATGGCYEGFPGCGSTRDLFNDNAVGMASGVNISRLLPVLRTILAIGWKPHLVLANVPIALSATPVIPAGGFGFNAAPPANYTEYQDYIQEVVAQCVAAFGVDEVASWRWTPFTEYNNQQWLLGNASVFAGIYEASLCGVYEALGRNMSLVQMGVHACVQCGGGAWDPLQFLDWIAANTTMLRCGRPHLSWAGNSFYEDAPGIPGNLAFWQEQGLAMLAGASARQLPTTRYSIDEGRLLFGPEGPAYGLLTRAVGDAYQGSWDAFFAQQLLTTSAPFSCSEAFYARWGLTANGGPLAPTDTTVDNVAVNVARLAYRLAGGRLVQNVKNTSATLPPANIVNAAVSVFPHHASSTTVVRALFFHHYTQLHVSADITAPAPVIDVANASFRLCGLPADSDVRNATISRVDDTHANFWPLWREDAQKHNISRQNGDYQEGWSEYSDNIPFASSRGPQVFQANLHKYIRAARLREFPLGSIGTDSTAAAVAIDGCLELSLLLPPHGVALVDVTLPF